jgi:hypothetical protein
MAIVVGLLMYSLAFYLIVVYYLSSYCTCHFDTMTAARDTFQITKHSNSSLVQTQQQSHDTQQHEKQQRDTSFHKIPLFNPWRDFVFTDVNIPNSIQFNNKTNTSNDHDDADISYYSTYTCVAAARNTRRADHTSRTCHYQNLYYHISTQTWYYYPHPTEQRQLKTPANFYDMVDASLWHVREAYDGPIVERHSTPFRPKLFQDLEQKNNNNGREKTSQSFSKFKLLSTNNGMKPVFNLYMGSMANFGHFIWDDYLSIFSQLDLLDLSNDDTILPIPFVQDPTSYQVGSYCLSNNAYTYPSCLKFTKRLYPALWNMDTDCSGDILRSNNWLQGLHTIGAWQDHSRQPCGDYRDDITNIVNHTDYVIVPSVTVGSGRLAMFSCYGECTLGRGPQLFRYRNFLVRRMLGDAHATHPRGYITFSLPYGATRGAGEVTFFEQEIYEAQQMYGYHAVQAVDFANQTMNKQVQLIANSAVLFTNHGGGSASSMFLPKHSTAFMYWRGQQRDEEFYRSVAYFTTEWIEYRQRQDIKRTMRLLAMHLTQTSLRYPNHNMIWQQTTQNKQSIENP